jgi:hypothetical protein
MVTFFPSHSTTTLAGDFWRFMRSRSRYKSCSTTIGANDTVNVAQEKTSPDRAPSGRAEALERV